MLCLWHAELLSLDVLSFYLNLINLNVIDVLHSLSMLFVGSSYLERTLVGCVAVHHHDVTLI